MSLKLLLVIRLCDKALFSFGSRTETLIFHLYYVTHVFFKLVTHPTNTFHQFQFIFPNFYIPSLFSSTVTGAKITEGGWYQWRHREILHGTLFVNVKYQKENLYLISLHSS